MRRPYTIIIVPAVMALMSAVLSACSGGGSSDQSDDPGVIEVQTLWDVAKARDLATLTAASDEVFVGRVVSLTGEQQLSEPGRFDPPGARGSFPLSRFEVRVQRPLTGDLSPGDTVTVEQLGGFTTLEDGSKARLVLESDEPLAVGARYLFFGSRKDNGSLSAPPFGRLMVDEAGALHPMSSWGTVGVMRALSGLSVDGAAEEVAAVVAEDSP